MAVRLSVPEHARFVPDAVVRRQRAQLAHLGHQHALQHVGVVVDDGALLVVLPAVVEHQLPTETQLH